MQRCGLAVEGDEASAINSHEFPNHLPWSGVAELLGRAPGLAFDGQLLAPDVTGVREDVRRTFGLEIEALVTDLGSASALEGGNARGELGRALLLRGVAALTLFEARRAG
jgi:hypothetical protein